MTGLGKITGAVGLLLTLAACERNAGTPAPVGVATAAPAAAQSYELVLVRRPVSMTDYTNWQKGFYDLCKAGAEATGQAVKPFVTLPDDFVMERETRVSDGTTFVYKLEQFGIDVEHMLPENGCATRIVTGGVIERIANGVVTHTDIDQDGRRVTAEPISSGPSKRIPGDGDGYTVSRSVNGIKLKCIPPDSPLLVPGVVTEHCIADGGAIGLLREPGGALLVAYQRDELSKGAGGSVSVLEPVALTIGAIDAARLRELSK